MVRLVESMSADHPAKPVVVLANSADAGGLAKAAALGVSCEAVDHRPYGADRAAFEDQLLKTLAPYELDIICLAGFMRVLTDRFITPWAGRMLNIHPSLLPKYKGLHTHQRALDAGDDIAGCTVHEVTPKLDDGPILGQAQVPILPIDTAQTLAERVLIQEHKLYPAVLRAFCLNQKDPIFLPS